VPDPNYANIEACSRPADPKLSRQMHINPNFANRPLPSIPPPKPARNSISRTQSFSPSSSSTYPRVTPREPIYARLNDPLLKLDDAKKESFDAAIKNKVLVNPNFSGTMAVTRRTAKTVPSKPMRHSLMVTSDVAKHLDLPMKRVKSSITVTPKASVNKENLPSTSKTRMNNLFTPLRKSAFKKIGSRKLVRRKSGSPGTPKASFKKIGNKKLIRIVDGENKGNETASSSFFDVKTKTKLIKNVKNTPSNAAKYKFSFITPLTGKKSRNRVHDSGSIKKSSGKKTLSSFRSRFKLDRRQKLTKTEPKVLFQGGTKMKKMAGSTYRVSATKLSKVGTNTKKPGPSGIKAQTGVPNKVISVQGVKFSVAENGRKLRRLPPAPVTSGSTTTSPGMSGYAASVSASCPTNQSSSPQTDSANQRPGSVGGGDSGISSRASPVTGVASPRVNTSLASSKKMYLGGEELEEVEPGVFTRSRHSLTRQSITQAKTRSINTIIKHQTRSKQYCMFYNKFGKCTKKEAGTCPYIHDREKIAVCRRYLQGSCLKEHCLLTHKVAPEKMPVCKYFLEGVCSREDCPYLHVKVANTASICQKFLKGYCANGSDCTQRHVMACPEYDRLGVCSKPAGKCPFPHVTKDKEKRVPPVKPKRKSLGQTPADHKKSRVATARYFDKEAVTKEITPEEAETTEESSLTSAASETNSEMEAKRKRLLRKIELAKQGWTGISVSLVDDLEEDTVIHHDQEKLDESGPYEKIADGDEEEDDSVSPRPPMGQLGDFISLAGYSSEDEDLHTDHRLI